MIRFEPRATDRPAGRIVILVVTAAAALALAALVLAAMALLVGHGSASVHAGPFGSRTMLSETSTRAAPLILTGLAASVAFRIRLYNFGGEGQFLVGALAAMAAAASPAPPWAMFALLLAAGAMAGAALMFIAAVLKIKRGADEAIVTLLLNFVALLCVQMALGGALAGWVATAPKFADRVGVHSGLLVALAAAIVIVVLVRYTVWGLQIRAVAGNPETARFVGIRVGRTTARVGLISGALAGLAGAVAVASEQIIPAQSMYSGLGYAGIAVAVLAGQSVLGVVIAGILVAGILVGSGALTGVGALPASFEDIFIALVLMLSLIGTMHLRYRVVFVRAGKTAP